MATNQSPPNPTGKVNASPDALGTHRGAIDQTMITTQPPSNVMKRVSAVLHAMGVEVQEESTFNYRCIRAKKDQSAEDAPRSQGLLNNVLYGSASDDSADEVRFSVELTELSGLSGTYSLDIRRLKGNLRSYKFIYDTIRERLELNR